MLKKLPADCVVNISSEGGQRLSECSGLTHVVMVVVTTGGENHSSIKLAKYGDSVSLEPDFIPWTTPDEMIKNIKFSIVNKLRLTGAAQKIMLGDK